MSSASRTTESIDISLSTEEALVLYEWLSRNREETDWQQSDFFSDPAEKKLISDIEGSLELVIHETFAKNYGDIIEKAYRSVLPIEEKKYWE